MCSDALGGVPGSQAEFCRVPFADLNCYPIPDDVPDEKALYMSDVLCTALHSVVMAEVQEGSTVAIWGLGPIGLMAVRWCASCLHVKRLVLRCAVVVPSVLDACFIRRISG